MLHYAARLNVYRKTRSLMSLVIGERAVRSAVHCSFLFSFLIEARLLVTTLSRYRRGGHHLASLLLQSSIANEVLFSGVSFLLIK